MKNDRYIEYIQLARKIVNDANLLYVRYNEIAFEIVLKHLIDSDPTDTSNFEDAVEAEIGRRKKNARESRKERD